MNSLKGFLRLGFVGGCAFLGGAAAVVCQTRLPGVLNAEPVRSPASPAGFGPGGEASRLSDQFERVARLVGPSVVAIEATKPPSGGADGKNRPVEESGSGVLVRFEGHAGFYALTNNHVVTQAPTNQITITSHNGRLYRPDRMWADPESDIALLRLEDADSLATATLGNSESVRVGQWVLAFGSPFGLNQTVTHGIISARERGQVSLGGTIRIKDFLQTDAAINPGSSGGPLVTLDGDVIGINTAIASHSGSNSGVAFSIPINLAKRVARQLLEKGAVSRGYLGLQLATSFESADALKLGLDRVQGGLIETVFPETPAEKAGLRSNDIILRVDEVVIRNENHLINLISGLQSGQRIRLHVWRERRAMTLEATVGDWATAQSKLK